MPPPASPLLPIGRVVVFCPMRIEHRAVQRALTAAGLSRVKVMQTGIGAQAVAAALAREASSEGMDVAVLAGACGALADLEDVPLVSRIINEHGSEWPCPLAHLVPASGPAVTLIGVDRIVATPTDKAALAAATGAAAVDMESHAFARECERRGLPWAVVRGVSDTPLQMLPPEVLGWISPGGDTRAWRAARDLAVRPRLVPHMARVLARSARVLPAVGAVVAGLVAGLALVDAAAA